MDHVTSLYVPRKFEWNGKILFRFLYTLNSVLLILHLFATDRWPSVIRKWLVLCSWPLVTKNVRVTRRCRTKSACCGPMRSYLIKELSYLPVRTTVGTNTITETLWFSVKSLRFSPGLCKHFKQLNINTVQSHFLLQKLLGCSRMCPGSTQTCLIR